MAEKAWILFLAFPAAIRAVRTGDRTGTVLTVWAATACTALSVHTPV